MAISQQNSSGNRPSRCSPKRNGNKDLEIKKNLIRKKSSPFKTLSQRVIQNALKNSRSKVKQVPIKKCLASVETNYSAMKRAEEVQANLPSKFPSCIKPMLSSHVTGGFWLSLPRSFCSVHMPKEGEHKVVLVNEKREEYETKYLSRKNGLSGGWRGFAIAHRLVEGDVLIFQMIQRFKFKVYIVRANKLTDLDGAIGLLTLDRYARSSVEKDQTEKAMEICEESEDDDEDGYFDHPIPLNICKDEILKYELRTSKNESNDDVGSEVLEGIRFSESIPKFENVKGIDSFTICIDGLIIDSEIPPHLRVKYYDLCCSQKKFLHENFLKGLNLSLVSGIISETVNIADAIKASKFTIKKESLMIWDQTLEGFEKLGMGIGFLRARIDRLVNLAVRSETVLENKKTERRKAEEEMRVLEAKFMELKESVKVLDSEIEWLMGDNETIKAMFKKEASASW